MNNERGDLHANHRQRLLNLIKEVGFDKIDEYKALEFILAYIVPRKDTNALAHKLLDEYGTISAVLDAPANDLVLFSGIKQRTADMLTMLPEIFQRYSKDKFGKKPCIKTIGDIINYFKVILKDRAKEELFVACLNAKDQIISVRKMSVGNEVKVAVSANELVTYITVNKPKVVYFAHCHPDGTATPSNADILATEKFKQILSIVGTKFGDHLIVGNDGVFSFVLERIVENGDE